MRIFRWLIIILIVGGFMAGQIFFVVDETNQAIVLQFGDPIRIIRSPGLAAKLPFLQNVIFFDKRILSSDAPPQEYLTTDKKRLVVDHVTRWRIDDPLLFFQAVGTEAGARARLDDIVFSELREELAKVDFVEVISQERESIMERVAASAEEKASEFGIDIVDVRVKRADLPVEVEQSVYLRGPRACGARARPWPSASMPRPWSKTRSSTPSPGVWKPTRPSSRKGTLSSSPSIRTSSAT